MIKFLRENKELLSNSEIALALEESPIKISRILKILVKFGDVGVKEISHKEAMKITKEKGLPYVKRRMRLFYYIQN